MNFPDFCYIFLLGVFLEYFIAFLFLTNRTHFREKFYSVLNLVHM